ncbi:MAG: hypothetical protein IJ091_05800, partial [Oscillospiraceae bacterium]|nr:hypothetical protein [Oscillospiraceae bacterium]
MRKIIALLLIALIFTACGSQDHEPVSPPVSNPVDPVSGGDTSTDNTDGTASSKEMVKAYLDSMDDYEDLEIAFLGDMNSWRSLDDILERAENEFGFSFLSELGEEDIVYGEMDEYENGVYLIIPARNVDLSIGKYSWYADGMTEIWYKGEGSGPILFIEGVEDTMPPSIIEYVRYGNGFSADGFMLTGFNVTSSHLRTDYHMGIVDITPYDDLDPSEVPSYLQGFFDSLTLVAEVQEGITQKGKNL